MLWRLALIVFLGPLGTLILGLPILGEGALLLLSAYPIFVVCSALCAPFVYRYLRYGKSPISVQAAFVSALGFAGGAVITMFIFRSSPDGIEHTFRAALIYGGIGALHAIVLWLLASFGPLRVVHRSPRESEEGT
jgi:hypothetical protein